MYWPAAMFLRQALFVGAIHESPVSLSLCHSEPHSGEETREQSTDATEYGILRWRSG